MVKDPQEDSNALFTLVPRGADRLGLEPLSFSAPTPIYTVSMTYIDSLRTKANECLDVVRNTPYQYDSFAQAVAVATYWNLYEQIEILLRVYRKEHYI